jgi:methylase of polypeptide subunit release factors
MASYPKSDPSNIVGAAVALGRYLRESDYAFITPTPLTHQRYMDRHQSTASNLREALGWNLPFNTDVIPSQLLNMLLDVGLVSHAEQDLYRANIRVSSLEPLLLLHSGFPTDAEDSVFFGPDTYRFAQAIRNQVSKISPPPSRIVDVGSGTGAGALLLAGIYPNADVWAADVSERALTFVQANAVLADLDIRPVLSDVLSGVEGQFDLVISNPPYMIDSSKRAYRDGGAELGAALSVRILTESLPRLAPNGTLLLYTGSAIVNGVDTFMKLANCALDPAMYEWSYIEMDPDVFGEDLVQDAYHAVERIAIGVLTVKKKPSS